MDLFEYANALDFGGIHFKADASSGLQTIVAIHNLNRGPAIGGCRFIEYPNTESAIRDAMRLAQGMTYKAAITNLPHGGAKAVIIRPPNLTEAQRENIFTEYGKFVDSLNGNYLTAEDSGTSVEDMNLVKKHTNHVLGSEAFEGASGDPSPFTALGVRRGLEAAVKHRYKRDDLENIHISVQGVGHVGYYLAKELHELGAKLTVTDMNSSAAERCADEFGATLVSPEDIYAVDADIFAPCALGAILNDKTIPQLKVDIIAGASNNQLAEARHGLVLKEKGILYTPDYALNAGGLISVAQEFAGYDEGKVREGCDHIFDTMLEIFERGDKDNLPMNIVADRIAEERFH